MSIKIFLMSKDLELIKKVKFELIMILLIILFPLLIWDFDKEFYHNQFEVALLINSLCFIIVYIFISSLRLSFLLTRIMVVLIIIWLCILPLIFYKIYSKNPILFSYNKDYLISLQQTNKEEFNSNENKFIELKSELKKEITKTIFKKVLPTNSDTLILLNKFIVISPYTFRGSNGLRAPKSFIKFYNRESGEFIFQIEKRKNLVESYNYFNNNIQFKINKIKKPQIGITYFDFWCSSIISFKDNLIIPLRNWIVALNFIYILIFLTPIFNYTREKYLKKTKSK